MTGGAAPQENKKRGPSRRIQNSGPLSGTEVGDNVSTRLIRLTDEMGDARQSLTENEKGARSAC